MNGADKVESYEIVNEQINTTDRLNKLLLKEYRRIIEDTTATEEYKEWTESEILRFMK